VFQLHGADAAGRALLRRKLQRNEVLAFFAELPACPVGIEACGTVHHWARENWAREIRALGHEVRLLPPAYVKPYVKRDSCVKRGRPTLPTPRRSARR
jgi:transposase